MWLWKAASRITDVSDQGLEFASKGAVQVSETTIFAGGTVVTCSEDRHILPRGYVAVSGDRIVAVTDDEGELKRYPGARRIDATDRVIMPGLVNAHAHLRPMRGLGEEMDVATWHSRYVDGISARMTYDDAYAGAGLTYIELLRRGMTTVLAMSIMEEPDVQAARDTGIRARVVRHAENRGHLDETIEKVAGQKDDETSRVRLWLGMEVVSMFKPEDLKIVRPAADQHGVRIHTHFSEFQREDTGLLEETGVLGEDVILAHCVRVNQQDIALFARTGTRVVHNPKSNMKFGSGIAPILAMVEQGVVVSLGTDGPMSTFGLDLFEEMRCAAFLQRVSALDATLLRAHDVLQLATLEGARALGMEATIGSLEVGKKADLIVINVDQPWMRPLFVDGPLPNLVPLLVFSVTGRDVETVMVDGRIVVENGSVLSVDEGAFKAEVQARGARLLREVV